MFRATFEILYDIMFYFSLKAWAFTQVVMFAYLLLLSFPGGYMIGYKKFVIQTVISDKGKGFIYGGNVPV